ncbi:MAG: hypothetical protein E7290_12490, partial [Lachnospiraceae bacterium]|nr:hypothetical protein [Lachnospiraceae bacterium]
KDLNLTPKEIRLLEAAYKRTNGEIHNITQTTALASERTFIDACDAAWWKATHGVSRDVAIMEAIEEVAAKGITTVHYANREEKIDVAIARAVKTGVNQANGDITLTRCAEMGVGYVLVNEHIGARVTKKEDYTNHAHWQGKVYKLDWSNPVLAKYQPTREEIKENKKSFGFLDKIRQFLTRKPAEKYEDFITVCGYGKMLGICGINCRHSFNPFYPDININTNQGVDKQENEERYRNEQKQRAMERNIRDLKRRELALKHAEGQTDNEEIFRRRTELEEKIDEKREEYIEFCSDNSLIRESHRLQIAKKYGVSNKKAEVRILNEYSTKDGKYIVDGKKVLADSKEHERKIAELLCETLEMDVCIVPRVMEPQGISTPDYLIGGRRYDLKEPIGNSKNTLYNMINKKKDQADNFVFDISKCPLELEEINRQIEEGIYKSSHTKFVQNIILVKDMKILKIYNRK